jgi:DNA-binding LacI/PurR family transcriptional regulator
LKTTSAALDCEETMASTIKEIAEQLNLSISTVSYALNDGPRPVSEAVARQVKDLARELGYRPNRLAKSLITGRIRTIGIVPIAAEDDFLATPSSGAVFNGAFNAAARLRQDVLVFTAHDRNKTDQVVDDILDSRVDGVIFIAPRPDSPALRQIEQSSLPYALAAGPKGRPRCYRVDDAEGAHAAIEFLFSLGHRRIAHVTGDPALADSAIRRDTYLEAMRHRQLLVPEEYVAIGDYLRASGYRAGIRFAEMKDRPTAIFCGNDDMAFGVIDALRRVGLSVPDEVSVVGFDDTPMAAHEQLTTVRQPLQQIVGDAFNAVVNEIETGERPPGACYPAPLIVRGSTAPAPTSTSETPSRTARWPDSMSRNVVT